MNSRIASIEVFRVVAIFAVIVIHCGPFGFAGSPSNKHTIAVLIDLSCRFAVPFFFIVSGYFLGEKVRSGKPVGAVFWSSARRLLSLYGLWCLFYFWVPLRYFYSPESGSWLSNVSNNFQRSVQYYGLNFPLNGTQELLWFLPALVMGLGIVTIFLAKGWMKYLPYVALALFVVGLLGSSYSLLWAGNDQMDVVISTRNGPFWSTLCVTLGWLISRQQARGRWRIPARSALAILMGGLCLQVLEAKGLSAVAGVPFRSFDYVVGTVIAGLGLFLLAITRPHWGATSPILSWSRYTLGIYLIHPVVIAGLRPWSDRYNNAIWEISFPLIVYLISLAMITVIARHPVLRRWVV